MIGNILSVGGISEMVPESLINAVGAVTGSGPAFVSIHETFPARKRWDYKVVRFDRQL